MSAFEKVYEIVKKIPEGRVATYGQIARLLGNPRYSRVVGYALHVVFAERQRRPFTLFVGRRNVRGVV